MRQTKNKMRSEGSQSDASGTANGEYPKRAVLYLRVSTIGQVNTDRDGEGFSIAAQRDACQRRAEALQAAVVDDLHRCRRVGPEIRPTSTASHVGATENRA